MNKPPAPFDGFFIGYRTQMPGTAIAVGIPPRKGARTRISQLNYSSGGTPHLLEFMRAKNFVLTSAQAMGGQTALALALDPGKYSTNWQYGAAPLAVDDLLAANDYICYECADGTFVFDTVAAVPASYPGLVTMTNSLRGGSLAVAVNAGAKVWFLGASGDIDPRTGLSNEQIGTFPSKTDYPVNEQSGYGLISSLGQYEPLLVYDANAVAGDNIERITGRYDQN